VESGLKEVIGGWLKTTLMKFQFTTVPIQTKENKRNSSADSGQPCPGPQSSLRLFSADNSTLSFIHSIAIFPIATHY
jgi:hypothetical protein